MQDKYTLLYNKLWIANVDKVKAVNPLHKIKEKWPNITKDTIVKSNTKLDIVHTELPTDAKKEQKPDISIKEQQKTNTPVIKEEPFNVANSQLVSIDSLILDWEQLVDKINNCTLCKLCYGRKNVVIERGSRTAKWMFVGEGPGEDEDIQGLPFVGKSGQLLDKMIAAMGLDKNNDVYICNVVKCRPPYNRNPEIEEINFCKNYLLSQIELVKPKIIVALGRFSSQTLLNSNLAIGKLRNKVQDFNGIPLIVTYHPAYLLRNPSAKKEAWVDLQLAIKTWDQKFKK